jgi:single-strand DNA-binding protein
MAGEPAITVIGNLGSDPEFRKTPKGISVTSFNVANTPRKNINGTWTEQETTWYRVFVWNADAAGTANSLRKGDKVIVQGRFQINTYLTKDGEERKSLEINSDFVGVIPKYVPEPHSMPVKENEGIDSDFSW